MPADKDERYMALAIELAMKGKGRTSPNPSVGAVIVKKNRVIGEGFHKRAGAAHAEVSAIKACKESPKGADLYVTLEPCNHNGKTGPCSDAIIESGISRVIIGARDQSPKKGARGAARLRKAGIEVTNGVLKSECDRLVADFHKHSFTGLPWLTMKTAMTLDGKIATKTGDSKWVTGVESRKRVHQMRNESDAVMIGVDTAIIDDPELTVRHGRTKKNPLRVVVDSRLRISEKLKLLTTVLKVPTLIVTTELAPKAKIKRLQKAGAGVLVTRSKRGKVNLQKLMEELGKRNIMRILLEGAGELSGAFLDEGLVDEVATFIAPKLVGGPNAPAISGGVSKMSDAHNLKDIIINFHGDDVLLEALINK